MIHYQLDYVIEEIKKDEPSFEQKTLKKYIGANFTNKEAKLVWERVIDHKWYVGERLKRDIGLRTAAVDYVENFYDSSLFRQRNNGGSNFFNRLTKFIKNMTRSYFISKSKTLLSF